MFSKFATRREFLNCGKLSLLFFLNSCSNLPNKVKIALQNSFYPESFKDTIPKDWKQEKINFENIRLQKNRNKILNSDFTLINDGWITSLNFAEFEKINEYALIKNLDKRSIDFFSKDLIHLINIALFRFDLLSRKCHIKGTPCLGKTKESLGSIFKYFEQRVYGTIATQASELINQLSIFLSSNNIAWLLSFFKELDELIF